MGKRKISTEDGSAKNKKRRKSVISNENTSPRDIDGLAQCFRLATITMYVSVAPMYAEGTLQGVCKQHLDPLVMNYFAPAHGVVIAYTDAKLLGQDEDGDGPAVAKVMNDSPFAYLWTQASLVVWSPQTGDTVVGWISLQGPSHIAVLIHDTFNATIRKEDIPTTYTFVPAADDENDHKSLGYWTDENGDRLEGKLAFTVKKFNVSGRTVLVHGSLLTLGDVKLPTIGPASTAADMSDIPAYASDSSS